MDSWNKKNPMTWFCGELEVWEASVKEPHDKYLEVSYSKSTISAKYIRSEKGDGKSSRKEVKMFLLNSKISDLQCYCAFLQSLFQKHSNLNWKKGWVHPSATATIIIRLVQGQNTSSHYQNWNHRLAALVCCSFQFAAQNITQHHLV